MVLLRSIESQLQVSNKKRKNLLLNNIFYKSILESGLVEMTSSFDMETTPIEPPAKQRHCSEPNALGSATRRYLILFLISIIYIVRESIFF